MKRIFILVIIGLAVGLGFWALQYYVIGPMAANSTAAKTNQTQEQTGVNSLDGDLQNTVTGVAAQNAAFKDQPDASKQMNEVKFLANGKEFTYGVEVARSDAERQKGLMNRQVLPVDRGMLFIFDKSKVLTFWMKNTLIPLDIIFVNQQGIVVDVVENARPCEKDPCEVFATRGPARYTIELNAGEVAKMGLKLGDKVAW